MRQLKISKQITNRNAGTLDKYLADIAKEALLTTDEEVELAQPHIAYLRRLLKSPYLRSIR